MYPSTKAMDSVHSGTGVFYQAMPAVGADGKNIMKLIPVQMVNGQFVQSQISQPKKNPTSQKAVTINIASAPVQMVKKSTLNPSATQQIVRKHVSLMNAFPNQADLDLGHSLNKHPLQQHNVNLMAIVPPVATPATNSGKSGRLPSQLPVTVRSPALPRGQYLQIAPDSQVPASERPAGMKKQIFTPPPRSSPNPSLSSLVYVSPITTVDPNTTPQSDSALHSLRLLCETSGNTLYGTPSKGSKPHLKLIPKASQRPNSPIKWVIEEEDSATAPTPDPVNSCVTSEIFRAVAERENANKHCDVITKPVSMSSRQRQENTLDTDNGKVVFVAKNCSLAYKMGTNDSPTAAQKSVEFNKTTILSTQRSLEPTAPQMKQGLRVIIPHESDEVIDLCDDDAHDDLSQQASSVQMSAVTQLDEDNVIFVSYIPPKGESESTQDLRPQTQVALIKETGRSGVTQQKSLDGATDNEICARRRREPDQSMSYNAVKNLTCVCDLPVMDMHDNEGSDISSQQSTSTQQLERMEVDVETRSPADPSTSDSSSGICSLIEKDTHRMENSVNPTASWTSSLAPGSLQRSDDLMRQIFGITANVKICLQRIDGASDWSLLAEPLQSESIRSVEDHGEPESGLREKDLFLKDLNSHQGTDSSNGHIDVRREKVTGQELSEDSATPSPHTDIGPLKCSHFKLNTQPLSVLKKKCHSGNTALKGISGDVETEPVIGYMEPIDEDFLSTDENDIPNSQDTASRPQTQTCVDLNTNTRRMGRTRKRTVCPCCIPGTQDPVVKSSAKSQEPEKWAWRTEQTNKRGGRTKAVRKDVKTSGRISCLTAKKKHNCKTSDEASASNTLTTSSMDSDELKQCEQIRRLKELLKEKEAALELLRNSSG